MRQGHGSRWLDPDVLNDILLWGHGERVHMWKTRSRLTFKNLERVPDEACS